MSTKDNKKVKGSNDFYTLLPIVNPTFNLIGKTVRCIKADVLDDYAGIPEDKRWHIGDEFKIAQIIIKPYGVLIYKNAEQNIKASRVVVID